MVRKPFAVAALVMFAAVGAQGDVVSPDGVWRLLDRVPEADQAKEAWVRPRAFAPAVLDGDALSRVLREAPLEDTDRGRRDPQVVWLPTPEGGFSRFSIVESPVMEAPLAARYPFIRTYVGQGLDERAATLRMDWTPQGFHAQVLSPGGAVYIDPYSRGDTALYSVYYKKDWMNPSAKEWRCMTEGDQRPVLGGGVDVPSGDQRRTYRLVVAATGEYTQFHGGTVAAGMAAIVTAVNRVVGVYEREFSVRMVLVANNDLVVYTNGSTDPYTNSNGSTMLGQNQTNVNAVIGSANYDIGHVFSTGGGGIAQLRSPCTTSKARGVTGLPQPIGDPFYIDYVAHEMGHQFGGNHSFNYCGGSGTASAAYEPGSASTIMSYAGLCGADDLQPNSDPYFVFHNYDEIRAFVTGATGSSCGALAATGNNWPTVSAGISYTIPRNTPFALTATGSDPNGDALTYCWEQRNLGPAIPLSSGDNGSSPIIRSWNPSSSPTRTIPRLSNLLNNTFAKGEILPSTSRTLNFRVTARDNRAGGGGVNTSDMSVTVTAAAGPFVVTSPNTAVSWSGQQTVTWNVANTTAAPVNCATVSILLSTDGGNTFPTALASGVPNTGSAQVTMPAVATTQARIKVQGDGNIFFDISNVNFTITAPACYANCDGSTTPPILNVNDFICFQTKYAANDPSANCDGSTAPPVLNVNDFICFQTRFAAGCP